VAIQVEGIILKSFDYGEKHKIIKILTPTLGVVGVFVSNGNKTNTKKSALVQPLTCAHFHLKNSNNPSSNLYYLSNGDVENYFLDLKMDYEKVTYFYCMAEIILKGLSETESSNYIYKILKQILVLAEEGRAAMYLLNLIFQLKMLSVLGLKPILDCCAICGTKTNIVLLSVNQGGLVCSNCVYLNEPVLIDANLIPIVRALDKIDLEHFPEIELEEKWLQPIEKFLEAYYDNYSGLHLKARQFLKDIT